MRKMFVIAIAAAILAACGEVQRSEEASTTVSGEEGSTDSPERHVARSVETEPGDWHYKESDGYPWAGFGPPASEAVFIISCRRGQVFFSHAMEVSGDDQRMTIEADGDTETIELRPIGGPVPMAEGALPANSMFIDTLLNTESAFTVSVKGRRFSLRPALEYRRVIRECRAG
ncbi:hypothetical protein PUV54_14510 [Hyphococcus flavus]|uniref:Lipoprotein n=1 Tax=Hyphococcus flavus TaxID=1866326 RepID=A0AAE9ZCU2_9PROT|nr:hypothetical protein [Hyphococcus flavus]WDI31160.1 hypothetical protein PUV54_14510 [Hyphococcus flavus]